jgi:hypothetical protein
MAEENKLIMGSMAEMLGVPLFTTYLYIPRYRAGEIGNWKIVNSANVLAPGYFKGLQMVGNLSALLRKRRNGQEGWETWMSISPSELESQELGCRYAFGHTVIMGLGMGWIAINAALKPTVSHVTVVELDPEVIELFSLSGAADTMPEEVKNKITIVNANALEWVADVKVDFLYADIWLSLDEPQTLEQVRRMNENLKAAAVYFWGQEIAIYAGIEKRQGKNVAIDAAAIKQCIAEDIGLPLLIPSDINYAGLIENVAKNRKERNLSMGRMLKP